MISLSSIVKGGSLLDLREKVDGFDKAVVQGNSHDSIFGMPEVKERRDFIIRQAIRKAQHIDSEALKRGDALIDNALRKCSQIMKDAEAKGYADGYANGLIHGTKAAENTAEASLEDIRKLIEDIKAEQSAARASQEKDMLEIAFRIARKIMKKEAERDEDFILRILEEVVQENEKGVRIYMSEYNKTLDVSIDKTFAERIQKRFKNTKAVLVQSEDTIVVETTSGLTDMSIQVQLGQLKEAVDQAE